MNPLFARIRAAARLEQLAVVSADGALTYGEAFLRAEQLVRLMGAAPTPMLLYGHKQPAMLVGILAALRCSRPYIPVDSAAPPERAARILALGHPGLVVAAEPVPPELGAEIAQRGLPIITLDPLATTLEQGNRARAGVDDDAHGYRLEAPAYIIFTSGTTGDPKGVAIPYRGLAHFAGWLSDMLCFVAGEEIFLNQAPFSFDLSVMDLYGALLTGGMLFAIGREEIAEPRLLFARLDGAPLTTWVSTPSFARFCLAEPRFRQSMLPNLRRFLFCGETLPPAVAASLLDRFPSAVVWNTYGPTETTVAVTAVQITAAMCTSSAALPVGSAAPSVDVWIGDPTEPLRRLAPGETGEIVIAGPQVALGYLRADDGHPVPAGPFLLLGDERYAYRTGDLGRLDGQTGQLYCAGRLDRQVKLHGYRLELEEIEAHLRRLPGIADAVVLPVERGGQAEYLLAYIIPADAVTTQRLTEEAHTYTQHIRISLARSLPAYALPRVVRPLIAPPLTANGKLDRRAVEQLPRT